MSEVLVRPLSGGSRWLLLALLLVGVATLTLIALILDPGAADGAMPQQLLAPMRWSPDQPA